MNKTMVDIGWNFDNSYEKLPDRFFTRIEPIPVKSPELVILNDTLAKTLGLNVEGLNTAEGIEILAGNRIPAGATPLAQAYAGHQFGHFTMLGDGRAHLLGEQITPGGERFDIQLKGSGRTPYSRGGDGRAALGPMLREYIISEAMYGLRIPTTRSLAVIATGEPVFRETPLPGAILTRVATGHIRVGTFQYIARWGTKEELKALADYTLTRHFAFDEVIDNPYLFLLQAVIKKQAQLIAQWQLVGFVHGVMNTDNMALSGETIDYGPCAFMDQYDPATVFSSIDTHGRYAYGNQPYIGAWNLAKFAETLLPLLDEDQEKAVEKAQEAINGFSQLYHCQWLAGMRSKLGIFNVEEQDQALIEGLLGLMEKYKADYNNTFQALTFDELKDMELFDSGEFTQWYEGWQARLARQHETKDLAHRLMKECNPAVIPRNHRVEEALKAAVDQGDYSVMMELLDVLANPYAHTRKQADYATLPPASMEPYITFCGT